MNLTIFEGPDGGGKTSAAKKLAERTGALYVHGGPRLGVYKDLAHFYLESMLPAVLGVSDVVMDRCWISEPIYGQVFRRGLNRLNPPQIRMLERVALRCKSQITFCLPSKGSCLRTFRSRIDEEMLEKEEQLADVWDIYQQYTSLTLNRSYLGSSLPASVYDYEQGMWQPGLGSVEHHPESSSSVGNLLAAFVLVCGDLPEPSDEDTILQAPFVSFRHGGCSMWLTAYLERAQIPERCLLWVHSSDPLAKATIKCHPRDKVVALGTAAEEWLLEAEIPHEFCHHPLDVMGCKDLDYNLAAKILG